MAKTYETLSLAVQPVRVHTFLNHISGNRIHWHQEMEILYFTEGEGVISCDLQEYDVRPGDIIVVNGKELHTGCIRGRGVSYYCFHVNTDFFHNRIGGEYVVFKHLITDPECAALLESVVRAQGRDGFMGTVAVKRDMYAFFALLGERYVDAVLSEEEYKRKFKRLDTFNAVLEYIDGHYNDELTVQGLADRFFMSPSYFAHLFQKRTGKGVTEYVNETRIRYACSFLERENTPIGEIALRVGFNDVNYFSRKFKAVCRMTPKEYRRQYADSQGK